MVIERIRKEKYLSLFNYVDVLPLHVAIHCAYLVFSKRAESAYSEGMEFGVKIEGWRRKLAFENFTDRCSLQRALLRVVV